MKKTGLSFILLFSSIISVFSQANSVSKLDPEYLNWYNSDLKKDDMVGTSVDLCYSELSKASDEQKTIIVAVIDSGVDIDHEDLKGQIWFNSDEIPDNNIDDDKNGYIDDMNGWNFIGNAQGENIHYENLEYTRIVRKKDTDDPNYARANSMYKTELAKRETEQENIQGFIQVYEKSKSIIKSKTDVSINSSEDLKKVNSSDPQVLSAKRFLQQRFDSGFTQESLDNLVSSNSDYLNYFLNKEFIARSIIGDDVNDIKERFYGNPDVKGPRSDHGTSVAGVIGAVRDNGLGINGIASNVKLMILRSTPRGDERDKDVALSIIYAVDNGADIINMSFGKAFSPQKELVDYAVKYAAEKGVLIVHAAGNSGYNIDLNESYPSPKYLNGDIAKNWISVGASTMKLDSEIAAIFSNFGSKYVDIFAPGVNIVSTDSANAYSMHDGTSLAAPVVTGIAALVLSSYPSLEPEELIEILLQSSFKFKKPKKVLTPNGKGEKRKKVKFETLSRSGGIINAYNALLEAERKFKTNGI